MFVIGETGAYQLQLTFFAIPILPLIKLSKNQY